MPTPPPDPNVYVDGRIRELELARDVALEAGDHLTYSRISRKIDIYRALRREAPPPAGEP